MNWQKRLLLIPFFLLPQFLNPNSTLQAQDRQPFNPAPTGPSGIIGGRPGASAGRIQPSQTFRPRSNLAPPGSRGLDAQDIPDTEMDRELPPSIANRDRKFGPEGVVNPYKGKRNGITLDESIERMLNDNLDLVQARGDITQAEADAITAGLRSNPVAYVDTQNVPYGHYSDQTTGGPIQYDFNIVYPLDLSKKRQARMKSAQFSKQAAEAKYEDVVRLGIDNLYMAFVDALIAQRNKDYRDGIEKKKPAGASDEPGSDEVNDLYESTFARLALLIGMPKDALKKRGLAGRIAYNRNEEPLLPSEDDLVKEALALRPDLASLRISINRADADIDVAKTSRFDDAQLLLQPYTYYRGVPPSAPQNSYGWAVGLTVPLPIYNRQQGNILKAQTISYQSRIQTESLENNIDAEVRQAWRQYRQARISVDRFIKENLLVEEQKNQAIDRLKTRFGDKGKDADKDMLFLITKMEKVINDSEEDQLKKIDELLVLSRRSMLKLNTVVGRRLLP